MRGKPAPWVIVAGGFHDRGGMDRANAELARYLLESGVAVRLVGHEIDRALAAHPLAEAHEVRRPRGLPGLAEAMLSRVGRRVARRTLAIDPRTRVVVNGGNCPWPDVNWVHAVHAAWPVSDAGSAWWTQYRNRRLKAWARTRERAALRAASLVVANSQGSERAVVERVGVEPRRVQTVYLGSDPDWGPAGADERAAARAAFGVPEGAPVVAFVGALGSDVNKGFDRLWDAWNRLTPSGDWDAHLLVAGSGWRLAGWREEARNRALTASVHFLGFTPRVREVLAAADLLVSPVRYEAYGLNVHEALCRGAAVMVSSTAGVVERFDPDMSEALLPAVVDSEMLAERLHAWRGDVAGWRARAAGTGERLRQRTWHDMAAEFVRTVEASPDARARRITT